MLTISSPSESVAVYAGDFSSTQLLDLTHDSYCNLYGLTVVRDDAIQFNNQLRFADRSHDEAGATTLLFAAAEAESELHLLVQSVEGVEVRLVERNAIATATEYPEFVFAVDSYAMMIEATSNVEAHLVEPIPAQLPGDYRCAAVYTLDPPHSGLTKPLGLTDLVRGPVDAASCGAPDVP